VYCQQEAVDRIGWTEEKAFKDLEGMEARFNLLVIEVKFNMS
jgi:hypothetical protein